MLTITPQQARAFFLERQFLSQPAADPLDIPRRLGAIQAQYAVSVPVAVFSRANGVTSAWVDDALATSRTLVKTWGMRGTLHAIASEDLPLFAASIGRRGVERMRAHLLENRGYTEESLAALNQEMLAHLESPITRKALHDRIPALKNLTWAGWGEDMKLLVYQGDAVFATPQDGTTSCFVRRDVWLPHVSWSLLEADSARRELLRRYLLSHAPARVSDYVYWSSLSTPTVRADLAALKDEVIEVRIDGYRETFYALAAHEDRLRDPLPPQPINILPKFDALVLAHRDKSLMIDMTYFKRISRPAGQIEAVVLLDGEASAVWRLKQKKKALEITLEPFRKLSKAEEKRIEAGFERLAAFYGLPAMTLTSRAL